MRRTLFLSLLVVLPGCTPRDSTPSPAPSSIPTSALSPVTPVVELSTSPDPEVYAGPQKVLVRPANYYTLVYAAPSDTGICNRLVAAMAPEFVASGPFVRKVGDNSDIDYLSEAGALFLGSSGLKEPWRYKRRDHPRLGLMYVAFQQADINADGVVDRLYRRQDAASPLPPTDDYTKHTLYVRLGTPNGPEPRDEITYDDITSPENQSGFAEFDLWKAQLGPHPYRAPHLHSFYNYSLFESGGETSLVAASPTFPTYEETELYLVKFVGREPYIACNLRGTMIVPTDMGNQPETSFRSPQK